MLPLCLLQEDIYLCTYFYNSCGDMRTSENHIPLLENNVVLALHYAKIMKT